MNNKSADELDEIFSDFYSYDREAEHISMPVSRAKEAIKSLIQAEVRKARVEELENLKSLLPEKGGAKKMSVAWLYETLEALTKEEKIK